MKYILEKNGKREIVEKKKHSKNYYISAVLKWLFCIGILALTLLLFQFLDKKLNDGRIVNKIINSGLSVSSTEKTENTESIAVHIAELTESELYEIVPETPYTEADLDYTNPDSRSQAENDDPGARPEISGQVENMEDYSAVFLGYPIWNGQAPKIISTFLESYDFSGKTIVPFCTSGSSPIGSSAENLRSLAPGADWLEGMRFSGSSDRDTVSDWISSLGLGLGAAS